MSNLISNNGITIKSILECGDIILRSDTDASDFNSGALIINGGMSVSQKTYLLGDVTLGDNLFINNDKNLNFQDASGTNMRMVCQADNNWIHYITNNAGVDTPVIAIPTRNSSSAFFTILPILNLNATVATTSGASLQTFGGILNRNVTDATELGSSSSFIFQGGGSIAKALYTGGRISMSGTTGFLRPNRVTTTQRNALNSSTPLNGMCIFNTTTSKMEYYDGAVWVQM